MLSNIFYSMRTQLEEGETYQGNEILVTLVDSVKQSTLHTIQQITTQLEKSVENLDELKDEEEHVEFSEEDEEELAIEDDVIVEEDEIVEDHTIEDDDIVEEEEDDDDF